MSDMTRIQIKRLKSISEPCGAGTPQIGFTQAFANPIRKFPRLRPNGKTIFKEVRLWMPAHPRQKDWLC